MKLKVIDKAFVRRITPFHLVDNSPWPLLSSSRIFFLISNFFFLFQKKRLFIFFFFFIIIVRIIWWRDVIRESSLLRFHTNFVQKNLLIGMILFISSEVLFFFRFFWAFFHSSLRVSVNLFLIWPPIRIEVLKPYRVPLLNTVVLLSSRITVTLSHYSIFKRNLINRLIRLFFTIILGIFFTILQYVEYVDSFFNISDSVYRSVFFITTRFHRFHVLVRSIFLLVSLFRILFRHFNSNQHVRLECSIWYWHFVDVVWIFLYVSIYWWRSYV